MIKMHLKKRKRISQKSVFLFVIVIIVICVIKSIDFINEKINPILIKYAELEVNKFSNIIINNAVNDMIDNRIANQDLFTIVVSDDGYIQTIDFNSGIINELLNVITKNIQINLRNLENGKLEKLDIEEAIDAADQRKKIKKGIIAEIPTGVIFNNSILSNLGPKIPIRLHYFGNINSNITTKVTQYGINNALIEIGIHIEVNAQIVLPHLIKKIKINSDMPIAIKMIQGKVPEFYDSGYFKESSPISLPFYKQS